MAFDLDKMLHRKGEFETARLDDFAFRTRARTMRLVAEALGRDRVGVDDAYYRARSTAERTLCDELGDPTPVRLA